jgi:hypothetical protein
MMAEATTTVAVTIAVASEIHGCTPTSYVANAKISELLEADEAIGLSALRALQPYSYPFKLAVFGPKVKGNALSAVSQFRLTRSRSTSLITVSGALQDLESNPCGRAGLADPISSLEEIVRLAP